MIFSSSSLQLYHKKAITEVVSSSSLNHSSHVQNSQFKENKHIPELRASDNVPCTVSQFTGRLIHSLVSNLEFASYHCSLIRFTGLFSLFSVQPKCGSNLVTLMNLQFSSSKYGLIQFACFLGSIQSIVIFNEYAISKSSMMSSNLINF